MQIRIVRLGARNPLARLALVVVGLVLVAVLAVFGLALLAGLAAAGAVALLARRLLGPRRPLPAAAPTLDPAGEVFPAARPAAGGALPPGARTDREAR